MRIVLPDFSLLNSAAENFNANHVASINKGVENENSIQSNLSQINFIKENTDPAAVDSIVEVLSKVTEDDTAILNQLGTVQANLNQAIADETAARQLAIGAVETRLDENDLQDQDVADALAAANDAIAKIIAS